MLATKLVSSCLVVLLLLALDVGANPPPKKAPPPPPLPKPKVAATTDQPVSLEAQLGTCPQGPEWVRLGSNCYSWSGNQSEYWERAERRCNIDYNGHLTSVVNGFEHSFVSKLTYCRSAWIGLYAVDVDKLNQPSNYRWTDNSDRSYIQPHNFTGIPNIHHPLISTHNLQWINNVYHARHPYVCKVKSPEKNVTCDCPTGWSQLDGYCYKMPNFPATYIEADFYCRGRGAYVTSVHSKRELRALSLLDIESQGCPFDTWIGLLKLNPCRVDFSTGARICFRWSDRSGDYNGLPEWQSGSPSEDQVTNCVLLKDEQIRTVPCHTRARFVCKKRVQPAAAGAGRKCPA